jgi:hypothetical protein
VVGAMAGAVKSRRRVAAGVAAAGMAALALAPAALASTEVPIYAGSLDNLVQGARHSLTSVQFTRYSDHDGCVNADNGAGTYAGTSYCTSAATNVNYVDHPYGGDLRYGDAFPINIQTYYYSTGYWREYY